MLPSGLRSVNEIFVYLPYFRIIWIYSSWWFGLFHPFWREGALMFINVVHTIQTGGHLSLCHHRLHLSCLHFCHGFLKSCKIFIRRAWSLSSACDLINVYDHRLLCNAWLTDVTHNKISKLLEYIERNNSKSDLFFWFAYLNLDKR